MTAKEYLSQAFWVDVGIGSKLDQLERLNALATRATTTFSQTPVSGTRNPHRTEDVVIKIIMLEDKLKEDMNRLVELKADITKAIEGVDVKEYRILLEKRYLSFMKWEDIAFDMHCSLRTIYRMHGEALKKVRVS